MINIDVKIKIWFWSCENRI